MWILDIIAQIIIGTVGVAAFLLVLRDSYQLKYTGIILGLVSSPFFWITALYHEQYYTIPVHVCYSFGWIDSFIRIRKYD